MTDISPVLSALGVGSLLKFSGAAPKLRQVTNRVALSNQISGSATRAGWRAWQTAYTPLTAIQVGIWNGYTNSALSGVETGCGGPLTAALSIEYPMGTFTRLTWAGASQGVIADNAVGYTDVVPLGFTIPAGAKFRIAGDYQYLGGSGKIPSSGWANCSDRSGGDEFQNNTTQDYTMVSTVMAPGGSLAQGIFPQLVLGLSDRNVWGIVGDSISAGVNDTMFDPSGGRGLLGKALAKFGPHVNFGVPGDRATWYAANSAIRRGMLAAAGVTSVALQLGINDVTNSRTLANVQADRATIRAFFTGSGINVFDTTLPPTTSSTDTFKTAANQTVSGSSAVRTAFNDSLRNGVLAGSSGMVDIAQLVETSTSFELGPVLNGGVWIPQYMTGSDGTHPNPFAINAVEPMISRMLGVIR